MTAVVQQASFERLKSCYRIVVVPLFARSLEIETAPATARLRVRAGGAGGEAERLQLSAERSVFVGAAGFLFYDLIFILWAIMVHSSGCSFANAGCCSSLVRDC